VSVNLGSDARLRTGNSLEARLLRRLLRSLGDPPIQFHLLWSDEWVTPTAIVPLEQLRIADRRTLFGLLYDAHALRRCQHAAHAILTGTEYTLNGVTGASLGGGAVSRCMDWAFTRGAGRFRQDRRNNDRVDRCRDAY
jgi:hypothetical protein